LDLHYVQTYNVATKRAHVDYFDIVVAAMPVLFLESRADPICYVMRKSLDIKTQLCYRNAWQYLKVFSLHQK